MNEAMTRLLDLLKRKAESNPMFPEATEGMDEEIAALKAFLDALMGLLLDHVTGGGLACSLAMVLGAIASEFLAATGGSDGVLRLNCYKEFLDDPIGMQECLDKLGPPPPEWMRSADTHLIHLRNIATVLADRCSASG
ncbi:MAG: hypothetical protein IPJ88_02095 [Myxococcales bacterium]|nr:MAG: hypothetical protein IPJ88_02095 [Myxococcales bacterium]